MLWEEAVNQWGNAPIVGHGWGYYREATGNVTHNEFLVFLVDTGVVGLLLYVALWTCVLRVISLARRSGRGDPLVLAAYQAGVISLLVAICFVNLYLPWLVVWAFVGLVLAHCSSLLQSGARASPVHGFSGGGFDRSLMAERGRGYWSPSGTSSSK
jgi:O-antigen ligase